MTPDDMVNELRAKGARLWRQGGDLRCQGPANVLTEEVTALLKLHKQEVLQILKAESGQVIDTVAHGLPLDRQLTAEEFTARYLNLMRAYESGVLDERMKDQGLDFLLDCWEPLKGNRPQ